MNKYGTWLLIGSVVFACAKFMIWWCGEDGISDIEQI